MSSLSNLLGDVYGDDPNPLEPTASPSAPTEGDSGVDSGVEAGVEAAVEATSDEPAVPEWAEQERLDRVFGEWEPGQLPERAPVADVDRTSPADTPDVSEVTVEPEVSGATEIPELPPVTVPVVTGPWQRRHDDIVPAGRARARVGVRLPFRR